MATQILLFEPQSDQALRLDDTGDLTYVGKAIPGSIESAAVWQIFRMDETAGGGDLDIEWADGESAFDKVWDDRMTLSYS